MKHFFTSGKWMVLMVSIVLTNLTFAQQFSIFKEANMSILTAPLTTPNETIVSNEVRELDSPAIKKTDNYSQENQLANTGIRSTANKAQVVDSPTYVFASTERVCSGDSIRLWATCNNGTVVWYLSATGTNAIGTGAPLTVHPINSSVYYAACDYDFQTSNRVATNQVTVFTKPGTPTNVLTNKALVCRGNAITLSGSCTDGTLVWYMNENDIDSMGIGTNFSVIPSAKTKFYAACISGSCKSSRVATNEVDVLDVPDQPTQVLTDRIEICKESSVTLTANCAIGGTSWYNSSAGGPVLDGGVQSPTENATYYCACTNNGCESPRVATAQIIVKAQPAMPASVTTNKTTICKGDQVTLSANCSIGTLSWYDRFTNGGAFLGTGNTITQTPDSSIIYYAACENGICISERAHTDLIVVNNHLEAPTNVAINYTEICAGSPVSLSASFNTGTLTWYTSASGGTTIGTGNNLAHNPTSTIVYYAACENGGCASTRVASTQLMVKPKPDKPNIQGNASICTGESIYLTASLTNPDAVCRWSNGATGFSVNVSPISNTNYKVLAIDNNCSSDSSDVFTIIVNPLPEAPDITTNNPAICKGGSALLTGQAMNASDTFYWSTPVQTNTSGSANKNTRIVTEPGTYKGWSESVFGCRSSEKSIIIMQAANCNGQNFISIMPEKPSICPNTSIILSANGCNGTITWTVNSSSYVGTAIKVSPSVTTSYMAQCSEGGTSSIDVVVANTNVVVANNYSTGIERMKAVLTLESSKKIGDPDFTPAPNVSFEAGRSILLKPGFVAERNSTFEAAIKGCN